MEMRRVSERDLPSILLRPIKRMTSEDDCWFSAYLRGRRSCWQSMCDSLQCALQQTTDVAHLAIHVFRSVSVRADTIEART